MSAPGPPVAAPGEVGALVERARRLAAQRTAPHGRGPLLLGLAGPPGAGKSTAAAELAEGLRAAGLRVASVPMDGFHYSRAACRALGRLERRGAPDTFDADGYVALLRRVRALRSGDRPVWAPCFDRDVHDPVAGDLAIPADADVVLTEGNYLLLDEAPWTELRVLLDETWYLDPDDDAARLTRLIARHERFGRTPEAARAHAIGSDQRNARLVAATRDRADLVVHWRTAG